MKELTNYVNEISNRFSQINMKKDSHVFIIYHREDNDGLFSQAIMTNYLINELGITNIDYLPADYVVLANITKSDIDDWKDKYDIVIMTDISFNNTNIFKYLIDTYGNNFYWIDHHAPIIKWSIQNGLDSVNGLRDTKHSALYNMFMYLYDPWRTNENNVPELFKVLSAWDSFTFEQNGYTKKHTMIVNKAVETMTQLERDATLKIVQEQITDYNAGVNDKISDTIMQMGSDIVSYDAFRFKELMSTCPKDFSIEHDNDTAMLFMDGPSSSIMFESLKKTNPEIKHGIVFHYKGGSTWTLSVYNVYDNDDFDCGKFCKEQFNGGGHKGAAGCTITQTVLKKILKTKQVKK